jgi:hypothetical protein
MRYARQYGKSNSGDRPGPRDGSDTTVANEPTGTADTSSLLGDASTDELLYILEEEKLAGDIYEAFAELYDVKIFEKIGASEDRHFDAVLAQATAQGVDTDAFVFEPAGSFVNPELQAIYDSFLETGSTSLTAALEIGVAIETKDITDLANAAETVAGTQLEAVYENLLAGSESHLAAFESLLG